jgi:hypothetical protein
MAKIETKKFLFNWSSPETVLSTDPAAFGVAPGAAA